GLTGLGVLLAMPANIRLADGQAIGALGLRQLQVNDFDRGTHGECEMSSVRMPRAPTGAGERVDRAGRLLARRQVPGLDTALTRLRNQLLTFRAECHAAHVAGLSLEGEE